MSKHLSDSVKQKLEEVCFKNLTPKGQKSITEMIQDGQTPTEIEKRVLQSLENMGITGHNKVNTAAKWRLAAIYAQRTAKKLPSTSSTDENMLPHAV